jgi:hypothetical protein
MRQTLAGAVMGAAILGGIVGMAPAVAAPGLPLQPQQESDTGGRPVATPGGGSSAVQVFPGVSSCPYCGPSISLRENAG